MGPPHRRRGRASLAVAGLAAVALGASCEGRPAPVTDLRLDFSVEPRVVSLSDSAALVLVRRTVRNPHWYPIELHLGGPPITYAGDVRKERGTTWGYRVRGVPPDSGGWTIRERVTDMDRPLLRLGPLERRSHVDTLAVRGRRLGDSRRPAPLHRGRPGEDGMSVGPGRYVVRGSFNRLETRPETIVVRP